VRRLESFRQRAPCLFPRGVGGQRRAVDRGDRARTLSQARSQCRWFRLMVTPAAAVDSHLYNNDLAPTTVASRTWTTYNYIALWFSMSMEVTTYMLASSLIAGGMNWKQAVLTILLGNLIVLIPMLLNAHAGAKYGIPFPVFVRASFGPVGANIPALLRAIVACGWFGIQSWIGGTAIAQMINVLAPSTVNMPWVVAVCF